MPSERKRQYGQSGATAVSRRAGSDRLIDGYRDQREGLLSDGAAEMANDMVPFLEYDYGM